MPTLELCDYSVAFNQLVEGYVGNGSVIDPTPCGGHLEGEYLVLEAGAKAYCQEAELSFIPLTVLICPPGRVGTEREVVYYLEE